MYINKISKKSVMIINNLINYYYTLQGNHCYQEKIWNGISLALEIGSTQMGQEPIEQQNLDTGKPREKIVRCTLKLVLLE